jgi:hypothetical protein
MNCKKHLETSESHCLFLEKELLEKTKSGFALKNALLQTKNELQEHKTLFTNEQQRFAQQRNRFEELVEQQNVLLQEKSHRYVI